MRPDRAHLDALERLYARAAVNTRFPSRLELPAAGKSLIRFTSDPGWYHAGGAVHGAVYFKMLDDAAFYAASSMLAEWFVLTTQFNLFLTRPLGAEPLVAEGNWVSGSRRVMIAEARLLNGRGEEVARGQGTFMRSRIALATLDGYGA